MITHLFRLIWNKKKQNFLLMLEIFVAFLGLFAGFNFILYPYNNYKLPTGLETENVWTVTLDGVQDIKSMDSLQIFRESLRKVVTSVDGVEDVTFSNVSIPFTGQGHTIDVKGNNIETWARHYAVEDNYLEMLSMKMVEGRWFSDDDKVSKDKPAVITENLKEQLFGEENALGKIITSGDPAEKMRIIGIMANFKQESEAEVPGPGLFERMDTSDMRIDYCLLMKVRPGADAALESRVHKALANTLRTSNVEIEHFTEIKAARNEVMRVPFIVFMIISGFLIINVGLGIFGVLWYNINKRRTEIGLRRAVGATGNAISWQLVAEAVLIATLSLLLGFVLVVQFPMLHVGGLPVENYITAIIYSIVFIYVLVILCALYPGRQAAAIYPAIALHED